MINTLPNIGELYIINDPEGWSSLIFIDTPFEEESTNAYYTQLAHIEDYGEGQEVYLGIEAGSMPISKITNKASDEDIHSIIDLVKNRNAEYTQLLDIWIKSIEKDSALKDTEKQRIRDALN